MPKGDKKPWLCLKCVFFYIESDNSIRIKVYEFDRYLPVLLLGVVQHQDLVSRVDGTFIDII